MKLQKETKGSNFSHIIKQMENAGELSPNSSSNSSSTLRNESEKKEVHCEISERVTLSMTSDGRIEKFEVNGVFALLIINPDLAKLRINYHLPSKSQFQFRNHPHLDKQKMNQNIIQMKLEERSFPLNSPLSVMKWRFTSTNESDLPLKITCWPTKSTEFYTVNVEYELTATFLEFTDVQIKIPIPQGNQPVVESNDGNYEFIHKSNTLNWTIQQIDVSNSSGSLEFTVPFSGDSSSFFPINVNFSSTKTYSQLLIESIKNRETNEEVDYSHNVTFTPEEYKIDF